MDSMLSVSDIASLSLKVEELYRGGLLVELDALDGRPL